MALANSGEETEMEIPSLMKCPMCGTNNDGGESICSCCSFELDNEYAADLLKEKAKQERARLFRILNIIAIVLTVGIAYYAIFVSASAGLFATIIYTSALIKNRRIRKAGGKPERSLNLEIAVLAVFVIHFILAFAWCLDAPPIPNDYTRDDLLYPGPEFDETWDLLTSLGNNEGDPNAESAIGLNADEIEVLEDLSFDLTDPNRTRGTREIMRIADEIRELWEHSEKGRQVVRRLGEFDRISDLSECRLDLDTAYLTNIKYLLRTYMAYACVQVQWGEDLGAVRTLTEFDGVFRKLSVNARSLIVKLVCYAVLMTDVQTANLVANNPFASEEAVQSLKEHFAPLTREQMSLDNCLVCEYLLFKNVISDAVPAELRAGLAKDRALGQFLKPNSALRVYRNMVDWWISLDGGENRTVFEELRVWPRFYPNVSVSPNSKGKFPLYYKYYNLVGAMLMEIVMPAIEKIRQIRMRVFINDDLFQIVLAMRLGRTYSLEARAYSDQYTVDLQRKLIYSPGPDGEPFTKDDIKLPINPEILNLN